MDKPGSWPQTPRLIIEDPALQTPAQKVLYGTLTVVFWALWIYLWLPLITLAGWTFGVFRFIDIMVVEQGLIALRHVMIFYLITVAAMGGTLVVWATYNWVRFSGQERRAATITENSGPLVAAAIGQAETNVLRWQHAKILLVSHLPDGKIESVKILG